MANKIQTRDAGLSTEIIGMLWMGITGAFIVGASFYIIQHWPHPIAVAPYFEDNLFGTGFLWGLFVGGAVGWIVGFMTDERHFSDVTYE